MPNPDYIPEADAAFHAWQTNFVAYVNANFAALGLTAADTTALGNAQVPWKTGYPAHVAAQAAAIAATQAKDEGRDSYVAHIRGLVRRLQASPSVSDAERGGLGITIRDGGGGTPVPPPVSRPLVMVESGGRLRHTVRFVDEATPTRRAKPKGVIGAEVWVALLPPSHTTPPTPESCTFLGTATRSPFVADFEGAEGGKNAHYMLRWINRRGVTGAWSETVTACV